MSLLYIGQSWQTTRGRNVNFTFPVFHFVRGHSWPVRVPQDGDFHFIIPRKAHPRNIPDISHFQLFSRNEQRRLTSSSATLTILCTTVCVGCSGGRPVFSTRTRKDSSRLLANSDISSLWIYECGKTRCNTRQRGIISSKSSAFFWWGAHSGDHHLWWFWIYRRNREIPFKHASSWNLSSISVQMLSTCARSEKGLSVGLLASSRFVQLFAPS